MKSLVIYDTLHGNTQAIAGAIADTIGGAIFQADEIDMDELVGNALLVIGSPTHGGFYTENIQNLLKALPSLAGVRVATFDTRTKTTVFGYASPKIARQLQKRGGSLVAPPEGFLVAPPEGFLVAGTQGPLLNGELERATTWACHLIA